MEKFSSANIVTAYFDNKNFSSWKQNLFSKCFLFYWIGILWQKKNNQKTQYGEGGWEINELLYILLFICPTMSEIRIKNPML